MSDFLNHTIADITHGRQSWRVIATLTTLSFAIGAALPFVQHLG